MYDQSGNDLADTHRIGGKRDKLPRRQEIRRRRRPSPKPAEHRDPGAEQLADIPTKPNL
ncbi:MULTISPECIES: hypothetical protein [Nocardiaceae]|uniref:hypothetical protein n=1 Tax=Nocardiaceae TaxID=85025 RepID=UPI000AADB24D|nr:MULTISPECIES: hypothetical protein [Rhodococcus]